MYKPPLPQNIRDLFDEIQNDRMRLESDPESCDFTAEDLRRRSLEAHHQMCLFVVATNGGKRPKTKGLRKKIGLGDTHRSIVGAKTLESLEEIRAGYAEQTEDARS